MGLRERQLLAVPATPSSPSSPSSVVWWMLSGFEVKDRAQRQETPNSLPAPPQMPLPEIPQPWLVSACSYRRSRAAGPLGHSRLRAGDNSPDLEERRPSLASGFPGLLVIDKREAGVCLKTGGARDPWKSVKSDFFLFQSEALAGTAMA